MFKEIGIALRPALSLLLLLAAITGLAYPALTTAVAQATMPFQANGSLITDGAQVRGSHLIAQGFASPRYFHPRASAAGKGYDGTASSGTNLSPGSKDLRDAIEGRVKDARAQGLTGDVPPDLVTTSASGLDPDISPEAAFFQASGVAKARGMAQAQVRDMVAKATVAPVLGIIGERRVNVLELNRQLDRIAPQAKP